MSTQPPTNENSREADSRLSPTQITEPVNAPTSEPATAQQLQAVEKQMSSFEKATLKWAKLAVGMSFLAAMFVCLQWYEMHQGGVDTHELAVAAKDQAAAAKSQAEETKKETTNTHDLAVAAKKQADETGRVVATTRDTLNISQQAYVTVGKPDGTVAEIVIPPDPGAKAAVLVYFQNTGHMPAKFNWGNDSPITATVPLDPTAVKEPYGEQWTQFTTDNVFAPMYRAKRRKQTNSFTWSGTITIAGNSSYEGILWEIPKERMLQLMNWDRPFMPSGKFQYCDGFGHHVCRRFSLRYAGNPYNKLFLASEEECATWEMQVLNPNPDLEYLNPCEIQERREELKGALKNSPKP